MKKLNIQGASHLLVPIVAVVLVAAVGTFMLVASHASTPCRSQNFHPGSKGECVKALQLILNIGSGDYNAPYKHPKADGKYGAETKAVVLQYQTKFGLSKDGEVGPETWNQICKVKVIKGHSSAQKAALSKAGC